MFSIGGNVALPARSRSQVRYEPLDLADGADPQVRHKTVITVFVIDNYLTRFAHISQPILMPGMSDSGLNWVRLVPNGTNQ